LLVCVALSASALDLKRPAVDEDIVQLVNSLGTTWTAGHNKRFRHSTLEHVKQLCGVLKGGPQLPLKKITPRKDLPPSFDPRDGSVWPACNASLNTIRDQGACGSCWAFGAVEAMTDRICIASKGQSQAYLAAEDLVSCCSILCGMGCNGGFPASAWGYWELAGIVTGGDWNSGEGCYPYQVQACDHHVTGKYQPCGDTVPTPACNKTCQDGSAWASAKHFGASSYAVSSDQTAIMTEIYTNGPVEGTYDVYEDFVAYKSGVYQHISGSYLGGHAIKILGWGEENGTPYWLVANSWNTDWGDAGYFKILRGSNECGIESGIHAGMPKL